MVSQKDSSQIMAAFKAAAPIMAGYVVLGLPCGILCGQAGLSWWMVAIMSLLFYSGAGEYMIPNMWLAGAGIPAIILSVTLVNTRQLLYATSLSRYCENASKRLAFLFGATVTDESFGVNLAKFAEGNWDVKSATMVNLFSLSSWTLATTAGVLIGELISVPTALASFAMTAIFICLLCMQRIDATNVITALSAVVGVVVCKLIGLSGPAIFIGAVLGIVAGVLYAQVKGNSQKHKPADPSPESQVRS
ncbi:MAG: AzlC family ABC transporter permease [Coriobacteriales bacterium]|nr:AzlC family ABC transporter permease [Coriobacteriales bacterium]